MRKHCFVPYFWNAKFMRNIDFEKIKDCSLMGVFTKTKISSEMVVTNVHANIELSFEKHCIELFLREDIMMT
jgi:hypothetical protein